MIVVGCYNDKESILYPDSQCTPTTTVSYQINIVPILSQYCNSCHSGTFPSGGVSLDDYTGAKKYADNGALMGSIRWSSGFASMPKNGNKLSACNIDKIQAWIDAGALNN
jgi:cytochrome c5